MTRVAVLIPTRGRNDKLARCAALLAQQTLPPDQFEVLVGVDGGPAPDALHAPTINLRVHTFDHAGPAATRNQLLRLATGTLTLLLNDDVRPSPRLLAEHLHAHESLGKPAMILGAAPFVRYDDDTIWDELIRETSMVFFYNRMHAALADGSAGRDHDWGFRHAWTLNLSMPTDILKSAGGFDERLKLPMFEDLEMAFRVRQQNPSTPIPVLYRPEAIVEHDHRVSLDEYLDREHRLGQAAWELAGAAPECAHAVYGRDLRSEAELNECRMVVERDQELCRAIRARLADLSRTSSTAPHDVHEEYERHLPLKRWTFRRGVLHAAGMS